MERIYLRVSLTPDCNFRCIYCSPEGRRLDGIRPIFPPSYLAMLRDAFDELGAPIYKVRFTGGEPLLVENIHEYAAPFSDGAEITLTTNGSLLARRLTDLVDAGVRRVNVSLDTVDGEAFRTVTGSDIRPVLAGIDAALSEGLGVKLNAVLMRSYTLPGAVDLVRFAQERSIEVRFIELMPLGPAKALWQEEYVSGDELKEILSRTFGEPHRLPDSGTATRWRFPSGAVVGFIDPVSHPFCARCDRVRMDHRGVLYHCLRVGRGEDAFKFFNDFNKLRESVARVLARKGLLPTQWSTSSPRCIGG